MVPSPHESTGSTTSDVAATALLETIQQTMRELHPHRAEMADVTLDSSLERELGFDSLGRVELLERLERTFGVRLPDHLLPHAETPRDILRAIPAATTRETTVRPAAMPAQSEVADATTAGPTRAQTLIDVLVWHVRTHPERRHITLYDETFTAEDISYAALYQGAKTIASGLRQRDLQPRQTVALMLPTSRAFFESFFGILLAGGIPVPLYPPLRPSQIEDHMRRQIGILSNAQAVMLVTVPEVQPLARLLRPQVETLSHVVTVQELASPQGDDTLPVSTANDTAFLQYTSGSTGTPKGVILTHANLLANLRAMMQTAQVSSQDVFVSWLPLYHDMGLIGAWLGSLYAAFHLVLMSPLAFLTRPERWLAAIHAHRGTISGGPNFAYELCQRRIDDAALAGMDLSCWRIAFNGAEPVSPATMQRFGERFVAYGFQREAMTPVYGLAENTLGLAFPPFGRGPRTDRVKREALMRSGRAVPADARDTDALAFVACGYPLPGHQIRIVDAMGYEVPERHEGRLEFCGPSMTSGYFRHPEATRQLFHDGWINSGDLAYIAEGEVFITGREKDLIIRAGRNIHPHELEDAIGQLQGIRQGCVAVFGSPDPATGTERLVVLAETRDTETSAQATLRAQIDALVADLLGTPPDDVVLAPPQTVLKTSSGKIRRAASRERYERGDIGTRPPAVWRQVVRLALAGLLPQAKRTGRVIMNLAYGGYVWGVCGLLAACTWLLVALLPRLSWRQGVAKAAARLMLGLTGLRLHVRGLDRLPGERPYILVANHASYLDAVVAVAVLPTGLSYVAKRDLAGAFFSRLLFQRLGIEPVERFDAQRSIEDTERVREAVKHGRTMVFFPEGTFGREPGLRPFRMGAFAIAAQTGTPIVPVAIRGTRSIFRARQWLPRRGAVRVHIGAPLAPGGTDWNAAIALREAAREAILQHCGEPALENPAERGPLSAGR